MLFYIAVFIVITTLVSHVAVAQEAPQFLLIRKNKGFYNETNIHRCGSPGGNPRRGDGWRTRI